MSNAQLDRVQPYSRRGVCPALSAPMQTGDGLLSRVALTDAISPRDMQTLCALATRHGNGLLDITARGGVQFRGLTPESAALLERDVSALGLPVRQGLAVEISPLAGFDETAIADPRGIMDRICQHAAAQDLHERLAAKMSVIVDGGGHVSMGGLLADIRLNAVKSGRDVWWLLMLGGTQDKALRAGALGEKDAADVVIDLLSCLADRGSDARGRDLDIKTVKAICAGRLVEDVSFSDASEVFEPQHYGLARLSDGVFAVSVAPAFGQISADGLASLCAQATTLGIRTVRPGPAHALFFVGEEGACSGLLDHARQAGFVTDAKDPRSSIAVCSGKPACASAYIATHELGDYAARHMSGLLDGSLSLHLSGCGKGCAHPASAPLTFSGSAGGLAFRYSGRAGDPADVILPFPEQRAALSRLAGLYEKEHKPGENARALLARLGKDRIVAALRQEDR
ncbi:precorrin-3B synthase [Rhizobium skierniewicense]|uniref:precorrin-3B synthase n=1 Tax=Rhizobium TaxID=379 RepID=UPI001FAC16BA|nr:MULTISPECIES: precorrin-3B synthase [Rhizobium]MCI9868010.1 precorrin-3B synthase [Rhizobium skierniewicense]